MFWENLNLKFMEVGQFLNEIKIIAESDLSLFLIFKQKRGHHVYI